jgi:hypothetical protein
MTNAFHPKFWKMVRKDGFMRSYMRIYQTVRDYNHTGGHLDMVKCVGKDEFGNRYFEDFGVDRSLIRPTQPPLGRTGLLQTASRSHRR